jgi:hypothetical protein
VGEDDNSTQPRGKYFGGQILPHMVRVEYSAYGYDYSHLEWDDEIGEYVDEGGDVLEPEYIEMDTGVEMHKEVEPDEHDLARGLTPVDLALEVLEEYWCTDSNWSDFKPNDMFYSTSESVEVGDYDYYYYLTLENFPVHAQAEFFYESKQFWPKWKTGSYMDGYNP